MDVIMNAVRRRVLIFGQDSPSRCPSASGSMHRSRVSVGCPQKLWTMGSESSSYAWRDPVKAHLGVQPPWERHQRHALGRRAEALVKLRRPGSMRSQPGLGWMFQGDFLS